MSRITRPLQWFRMYGEFITDPKMQVLAFEDQRHYVAALCIKALGILDSEYATQERREAVVARALGLDRRTCAEANVRLRTAGLVDENWQPVNWDKRQFRSDQDAAERKRRQRERDRLRA
jgi:hypothetical protein